jgi:hypothetical protein
MAAWQSPIAAVRFSGRLDRGDGHELANFRFVSRGGGS